MADAESAVIGKINAGGVWTTNTNLFRGPGVAPSLHESPFPTPCVSVMLTGGSEPINLSDGATPHQIKEYKVQVALRTAAGKYGTGRTQAQTVWGLLHDSPASGWSYMRCIQPAPIWFKLEPSGEHVFIINVRLGILE